MLASSPSCCWHAQVRSEARWIAEQRGEGMKRLIWASLVLSLAGLAIALAVLRPGGLGRSSASAVPQLYLDVVEDTGWCNTIDATATVSVGAVHKAAICLTGSTTAAKNLDIVVNFNTAINDCTNTGSVCGQP